MSQVNPIAGSIVQSSQVQRQQATQKDRQLRRLQELNKNVTLQDDQLEHTVESSEELVSTRGYRDHEEQKRKPGHHEASKEEGEEEKPTLDITA